MSDSHHDSIGTGRHTQKIEFVREGMTVEDAGGEELGQVKLVRMGDPEAATTQGNVRGPTDVVEALLETLTGTEPDLPEAQRARLLRYGYMQLDGQGLSDAERYVRADYIREVSGDRVTLTVRRSQLTE